MLVRLIVSAVIALSVAAGATEAKQCRPVVRHVVHHRPKCHCVAYHRASLRHRRHVETRVIERTRVEQSESWGADRAYRYAEADEHRWRGEGWDLRPSPPHPWDTNPSGYLTWPGKNQAYAEQDRYSGERP